MEKKPILVGAGDSIDADACARIIDRTLRKGLKSIGFGRQLSILLIIESMKKFLETEKVFPPFRKYLEQFVPLLEKYQAQRDEPDFFTRLANYALELDIKIYRLEDDTLDNLLIDVLRELNAEKKLNAYYGEPLLDIIDKRLQAKKHELVLIRSEKIKQRILQTGSELNFVDTPHAVIITRDLELSDEHLELIHEGRILSPEHKRHYKAFWLKTISQIENPRARRNIKDRSAKFNEKPKPHEKRPR